MLLILLKTFWAHFIFEYTILGLQNAPDEINPIWSANKSTLAKLGVRGKLPAGHWLYTPNRMQYFRRISAAGKCPDILQDSHWPLVWMISRLHREDKMLYRGSLHIENDRYHGQTISNLFAWRINVAILPSLTHLSTCALSGAIFRSHTSLPLFASLKLWSFNTSPWRAIITAALERRAALWQQPALSLLRNKSFTPGFMFTISEATLSNTEPTSNQSWSQASKMWTSVRT